MELAEGFVRVANANMAKAIRSISVAKGCDPRDYVLVPFGGAAGQHACAVARELGIGQILHHPHAGLLSAYGIGLADVERHRAAGVYEPLSPALVERLQAAAAELEREAAAGVVAEGIAREQVAATRWLELRYRGVEASLVVPFPEHDALARCSEAFAVEHRKLYGYVHADRELEVVAVRRRSPRPFGEPPALLGARGCAAAPPAGARGKSISTGSRARPRCSTAGSSGPAIPLPGRRSSARALRRRWSTRSGGPKSFRAASYWSCARRRRRERTAVSTEADPVMLEIFNNQFAAIAEQMGITLRNTSTSVNVKERLDFSCALFTPAGDLVVNAPHIPVHLGAMAETVRQVIAANPTITAGDVFVTNDPYQGGSHLPDITVVTPVHGAAGELLFFTASRAHHAELGGITPGSMPPFSRNLAEEGVLIRNFKLVDAGTPR